VREIVRTRAFERDLKLMVKRRKDIAKLEAVVQRLRSDRPLDARHKPHPLKGVWKPCWECHIEPDWLLVYEIKGNALYLARTGTHSDLFR